MNKQLAPDSLEPVPATLLFRNGHRAGTIYAHRVGGRIVEAYRGYGYGYSPIAAALRSDPNHSKT